MKHIGLLLTLFLTILSCSVSEKPQFIAIENVRVTESASKQITVVANARFNNPNDIKGELKTDDLVVFVNDNELAHVSSKSFKVPANQEFSIPLTAKIPTDSLYSDKNLSGLLGSLLTKKIKVQYKGDINYKVFGFSHSYTIDKSEQITLDF